MAIPSLTKLDISSVHNIVPVLNPTEPGISSVNIVPILCLTKLDISSVNMIAVLSPTEPGISFMNTLVSILSHT